MAFSPDGRRILTGSRDRTARLWDVEIVIPAEDVREIWLLLASGFLVSSDGTVSKADAAQQEAAWKVLKSHPAGQRSLEQQGRLIARQSIQAHVALALDAESKKNWLCARFHLRQLSQKNPAQSDLTSFDLQSLPRRLGTAEAELYQWSATVEAFEKYQAALPSDSNRWVLAAAARLATDRDKFRQYLSRMRTQFGTSTSPIDRDNLCRLSCWVRDAVSAYAPVVAMAEANVSGRANSQQFLETLGATQHRAGRFADAAATLHRVTELREKPAEGASQNPSIWVRLFLAMSLHQTGEKDAALAEYTAAVKQIDDELARDKTSADYPDWQQRLLYKVLREEVEALLKPPAQSEPAEPNLPAPR